MSRARANRAARAAAERRIAQMRRRSAPRHRLPGYRALIALGLCAARYGYALLLLAPIVLGMAAGAYAASAARDRHQSSVIEHIFHPHPGPALSP